MLSEVYIKSIKRPIQRRMILNFDYNILAGQTDFYVGPTRSLLIQRCVDL